MSWPYPGAGDRSECAPESSCTGNSLPARNGERRPPWRSLAPIRPPLFLSHAMKGDGVFQPGQGTARPEGDNASRRRHRQRAKAAATSNGHRPGTRAGTGQEMATRHRAGDAPQGRRRSSFRPRHPHPGGLPPRHLDPPDSFASAPPPTRPGSDTEHGPHRISPPLPKARPDKPYRKWLRFRLPPALGCH